MTDQSIIKKNSDLIWTIANLLRGPYRPPQYRRVMIPLTGLRRLDCVLEPTKKAVLTEYRMDRDGGIYGVDGCDQTQLAIKDRLKNNIQPSIMGLFEIIHEKHDNKDVLRLTIAGGLEKPYFLKKFGMTEKGCFFGGCSVPRNKEIMRVFRDLEIVEHLGSGVPRILEAYGRDAFEIRDSYIRITFRFAPDASSNAGGVIGGAMGGAIELSERQKDILGLIYANSKITYRQLAQRLEINDSAVIKHIKRKRRTETDWRNARPLGSHGRGRKMNLPAYPKTKPSGTRWLGDVPEHWEVRHRDGESGCEKHLAV